MSERLSEIRAHLVAARQLDSVITAMRGVAAARAREAHDRLGGVRTYAKALGDALSSALALIDERARRSASALRGGHARHIVLVFGSAQGFVGAYNERILDAAQRQAAAGAEQTSIYIVGERGAALAQERGLETAWTAPMAPRLDEAPLLADQIAEALYACVDARYETRVTLVHGAPGAASGHIVERPLIPLDLERFPANPHQMPPLVTLWPGMLVENLVQEYVFAELCEATILSFAAENEARMQAMIAARSNVQKSLQDLEARHRRQRQEEITEEIIELARPALQAQVAN